MFGRCYGCVFTWNKQIIDSSKPKRIKMRRCHKIELSSNKYNVVRSQQTSQYIPRKLRQREPLKVLNKINSIEKEENSNFT